MTSINIFQREGAAVGTHTIICLYAVFVYMTTILVHADSKMFSFSILYRVLFALLLMYIKILNFRIPEV